MSSDDGASTVSFFLQGRELLCYGRAEGSPLSRRLETAGRYKSNAKGRLI